MTGRPESLPQTPGSTPDEAQARLAEAALDLYTAAVATLGATSRDEDIAARKALRLAVAKADGQ